MAEKVALWVIVYVFTTFTCIFLLRREFTYQGGETIRAKDKPLHYWTVMVISLCATAICWCLAISRTWQ